MLREGATALGRESRHGLAGGLGRVRRPLPKEVGGLGKEAGPLGAELGPLGQGQGPVVIETDPKDRKVQHLFSLSGMPA